MENDRMMFYKKRRGTSGMSGQMYEIKLAMFLLLQGLIKKEKNYLNSFSLASNMLEAGDFDDIILKMRYEVGEKVYFIQLKHKDNPNKPRDKMTFDRLLSNTENKGIFNLNRYFTSFRQIKNHFTTNTANNEIFKSKFVNCQFLIYTNAESHLQFNDNHPNLKKIFLEPDHILNLNGNNYYYKICFGGQIDQQLRNVLGYSSNSKQLARELVKSLFPIDNNKAPEIQIQGIIRQYHKPLTNKIIEQKSFKVGVFRQNFLIDPENLSEKTQQFRNIFFEEILNKTNIQSVSEVIEQLQSMQIGFSDNFSQIEESDCDLPTDIITDDDIREFLDHLQLFIGQPNENQLEVILKQQMQSYFTIDISDINAKFSEVKNKVEKWWKGHEETMQYLTENNKFFEESVRISILFDVKKSIELFTGRKQELSDLHNKIQRSVDKMTVISQITSISGLGGIGKTELARRYIDQYKNHYDNNIIWIDAESESSLTKSFQRLAKDILKIETEDANGKQKDIKSILELINNFFKKRKCLFVFDNADGRDDLNDFLPSLISNDSKLNILITSRNREWGGKVEVLNLNPLDLDDAIILVKKGLNIIVDDQNQQIKNLVERLQCFPLALQQAIAYIKYQNKVGNFQILDYLEGYEQRAKDLLDFEKFRNIDDLYTKTTFTTWQYSIEKIQNNRLCLEILNFIAYFAPDKIPRNIFLTLADNNEEKLKEAICILVDLSLINGEQKQKIFNIHRLVQQVTRLKLQENQKEIDTLKKILKLLQNHLAITYVEHAISVWNCACQYEELIKEFSDIPIEIIDNLNENGQCRESCIFSLKNYKLLENILGKYHQNTLSIQNSTATALYKNGQYHESLHLYQHLYQIQVNQNCDYLDMLRILHNIANAFLKTGNYNMAFEYYEYVLKEFELKLGDQHPDTLSTMHNIAGALTAKGEYDEALKYYQKVLDKRIKSVGSSHPDTLNTLHNIANLLSGKRDYDGALNYYQQVLEKIQEKLGNDHPDTLRTMHNIAIALCDKKDYDSALRYTQKVLEKQQKKLGEDHPDTLRTMHNMANAFSGKQEYENALNYYEKVFEKQLEKLGENHPNTLSTMHYIANIFRCKGDYEIALNYYKEVLEKRRLKLGKEHPDTLRTMQNIVDICRDKGDFDGIPNYYEKVLKRHKKKLGDEQPNTLRTMHNVSFTLHRQIDSG